jgi:hypothetical protein
VLPHSKRYYLDIDDNGTKDYLLSFGPSWYSPSSGAQRPSDGQVVSIRGDVFRDNIPPLIVVTEIDGLVWRDSIGVRFMHNPVDIDSLREKGNHMGNRFGWCVRDSLITVTFSGKVTVDSISKHHKVYYLDTNTDSKEDYALMFGPWWYQPKSGAIRPSDGDMITITGGLMQRLGTNDTINFIIVYQINGLQWIDSIGRYPWPGRMISRGHFSSTRVNSMYNQNTYCNFESNSFGMGSINMFPSDIYSSITEIDPVYLPVDNVSNIIAAFSVNVMDNNMMGLFLPFDKNVNVNLNYNENELSASGVENKNLKLKLLLDNNTSVDVPYAKFNYINKTVSFSNSIPSGVYVIESQQQVTISTETQLTPEKFSLSQNFPNPFNPSTSISFSLPVKSNVRLIVYSLIGSEIRELVNNNLEAGNYRITWDGKNNYGNNVASGIYFYKLESDFGTITKKMNLLK